MNQSERTEKLKRLIIEKVHTTNAREQIDFHTDPNIWIFDFRKILLNGSSANLIADIFYEEFNDSYPFQLCGSEVSGIPLITASMLKFYSQGYEDVNAFFIRKSRKKTGLMKMIEGEILDDKKIILVDDTMNQGHTFWRQIEVLEGLGYTVDCVWSIIRYRDIAYYDRFHNRGIKVKSVFSLSDFKEVLGERISDTHGDDKAPVLPFNILWTFQSAKPSYNWVVGKSEPVLDDTKIYFGSDNMTFWALNQSDGSVAWQFKVGEHTKKKSIFSNPVLQNNHVIFGSYDGNVYALDKNTGKRVWTYFMADWVGSSPAIAKELNSVFIGLEFGLYRKHGGIVALDASSGKEKWSDTHSAFTHASPLYISEHKQVVIGSNDGRVRMYDAESGEKIWECITFGGANFPKNSDASFGDGDIKESCAYDAVHDYVIFGSIDNFLYIVERKTGNIVHHYKCEFSIWATPLIYKNRVYFTSVDKYLRCMDLDTFEIIFEKNIDNTRIFCRPTIIQDRLYVGTNAARLHELNPDTGEETGYFQACERITNAVQYNERTNTYYLPTYANEIIALTRKPNDS